MWRPYHVRFKEELKRGRVKKNLTAGEKFLRKMLLESDRWFWKLMRKTFKGKEQSERVRKLEKKHAYYMYK